MSNGGMEGYYFGVLVGAYLAMFLIGDNSYWWMPLVWVAFSIIFMAGFRLARKLINRHRRSTND